jgi:hypothetical protein
VVEPSFVFGGLETFLDGPSGTGHADQLRQLGVGWSVTEVVGDLVGVGDRAAGEQPVPALRFAPRPDVDRGPVVQPLTVGAVPATQPLPVSLGASISVSERAVA